MTDTFTTAERSRIMAAVKSKDTSPELLVRRLAHRLGYRFRLHVPALPGAPDLVFPRLRKIITVNGCFWHKHGCGRCRIPTSHRQYWLAKIERNAVRDRRNRRRLARLGWQVLVVWECETATARRQKLAAKVIRFLES